MKLRERFFDRSGCEVEPEAQHMRTYVSRPPHPTTFIPNTLTTAQLDTSAHLFGWVINLLPLMNSEY